MLHTYQNYALIITIMARISDKIPKIEGMGKKQICIYETYKNTVMPNGRHIYSKAYDMARATMCAYSQSDHVIPKLKCILRCCSQYPSINIPDQKTYDNNPNPSPSIGDIFIILLHVVQNMSVLA